MSNQLKDVISSALVNQLYRAANPQGKLAEMPQPTKEDGLSHDMKWVDYHIDYVNRLRNSFNVSYQDFIDSGRDYAVVAECPVAFSVYFNTPEDAPAQRYFLGWHINTSVFRTPCLLITEKAANELKEKFDLKKAVREGWNKFDAMDVVNLVDHLLCGNPWGRTVESKSALILRARNLSNVSVIGDSSFINPDDEFTLVRDYLHHKVATFNVFPRVHQLIGKSPNRVFAIPLFINGFYDNAVDPDTANQFHGHASWEILRK